MSKGQKRALETAELTGQAGAYTTAISSADGTKVMKNLDETITKYEESTSNRPKTFLGDVAKAANTITDWLKNRARDKSFTIELPETTRNLIRKALGNDFDSHLITANSIAHVKNNHGENASFQIFNSLQ